MEHKFVPHHLVLLRWMWIISNARVLFLVFFLFLVRNPIIFQEIYDRLIQNWCSMREICLSKINQLIYHASELVRIYEDRCFIWGGWKIMVTVTLIHSRGFLTSDDGGGIRIIKLWRNPFGSDPIQSKSMAFENQISIWVNKFHIKMWYFPIYTLYECFVSISRAFSNWYKRYSFSPSNFAQK